MGYLSEYGHNLAVWGLQVLPSWCIPSFAPKTAEPVDCLGLSFRNRVGLAAGWDKQAQCLRALQKLGFGFVEIGGVTPRPQPGNPRPRVFRLATHRAIINRYGLNSHGVEKVAKRLRRFKRKGMRVGANLAPNTDTPPEQWLADYTFSLRRLYPLVDYFTVNVSCPNTGHGQAQRSLELLDELMGGIAQEAAVCAAEAIKRPLLIKLSSDLDESSVLRLKEMAITHGFAGIVAVNTSTDRECVAGHAYAAEAGGLSGRPLYQRTRRTIDLLAQSPSSLELIAVGGIENKQQLNELAGKGVKLVQIYTRFVYRGPKCLSDLL
jgi:dihydroorotate dehydrogenase